jgi:Zn-dependent protease
MDWQRILYSVPGILLGLTVHECCHALCAWKLGDNTARDQGRITLNPLKHIDLIGSLFIIFAGFGWAKPVEFNPENLSNYRRDKALIAAAGPLSNMALGIVLVLIARLMLPNLGNYGVIGVNLFFVIYVAASINFGLFIFNLLPIPPLDGSHIVFSGLNLGIDIETKIRKIGLPLLFLLLIAQNHFNITILPIRKAVSAIMNFFM